jgi:hypothetical protein
MVARGRMFPWAALVHSYRLSLTGAAGAINAQERTRLPTARRASTMVRQQRRLGEVP